MLQPTGRRPSSFIARLALLLAISSASAGRAADVLTRITDLGPGTQDGLNELDGAVLGGFLYFVTQPGDGTTLYRTNGSAAPVPVPNVDAADPSEVIAWNGRIYFAGGDDREVWEYDPLDDSVGEVVEIRTNGNTVPQRFAATPDRLCFGGFTNAVGFEYHCWDGVTPATTYDLEPGADSGFPDDLVADGDRIAFVGRSGGESVVYFQDGNTMPVPVPVAAGQAYDSPCCLGFTNGVLYFDASDATNGAERLYRYDGATPASRVSETFEFDGVPGQLRNRLIVAGQDPSIGVTQTELFRLSGTTLTRVAPGSVVSSAVDPVEHDGALFLNGWNGIEVLYRYCGAGAVTLPVLAAGGEIAVPVEGPGISFAGRYYFAADSTVAGTELWALDSAHRHCDGFETGDAAAWSAVAP
jgi:hypothetical protein